jgi:hypothetical protein
MWTDHASFVPPDVFVRYRRMYPNASVDPRATPEARSVFLDVIRALHGGGVHLLLCDGSTRFVNESINVNLWRSLGTRNGGEVIGEY